ncbi:phage major capsid protein [Zavarzinella formosa]|uniref:phage major capsid protein n=1 Tax=Zavarzinella formosa TaxID=360055 RepID=UPI0003614A84|nr:phage major capsid protein [Zavarzinella formosa]
MADTIAIRSSKEIENEKAKLIGEAEALQTRSRTENLSPEQEAELENCLSRAEQCDTELVKAYREERLAVQRERMAQPTRPAPQIFTPQNLFVSNGSKAEMQAEGMRLWLQSHTGEADRTSGAIMRARSAGFDLGAPTAKIACDYNGGFNRKRTILSKGGSGSGADWVPKTYSQKVTEYLTLQSPLLSYLQSEVTSDGNDRIYFKVDDTAMVADYITASSGSETSPTIPDTNLATSSVTIKAFDLTSGFQKVTYQSLRDSAINVEEKIALANANSFARKIEQDVILGAANGASAIGGILLSGTQSGSDIEISDFAISHVEQCVFDVPQQYRNNLVWVVSPSMEMKLRQVFKTTTGKSLFETNASDPVGIQRLLGYPVVVSQYMASFAAGNKPLMLFNPDHYMLRVVEGQIFQVMRERFAPHVAYMGIASVGGGWLGPATSNRWIKIVADS